MKSLPQNTMALLLDLEPPSSNNKKDDRGFHNLEVVKKFKAIIARLLAASQKAKSRLSFYFQKIRDFGTLAMSNKYLPHYAICVLAVLVAFSNINDRVQAYNLTHEINNLDPNIEQAIADSVDSFTPIIQGDSTQAEKANEAAQYSAGFVANAAPTTTQITARTEPLPDNSKDTVYYIVRSGDTLSALAWKFGVKIATLSYTNDLSNTDVIKPGARLKIPVRGYEVPATLIAQKAAAKQAAQATATAKANAAKNAKLAISRPAGSAQNAYPFGWCTYYVATRRQIPGSWGNAGQWLGSAQRAGYPTGSKPVPGAIVVTRESFWGHVAYVESVNGDDFTVSEMNAPIWGVRTTRTISTSSSKIKGFIY